MTDVGLFKELVTAAHGALGKVKQSLAAHDWGCRKTARTMSTRRNRGDITPARGSHRRKMSLTELLFLFAAESHLL